MLTATLRKSFGFPNNIKNEVSCYFTHIYNKSVGWYVRAPYTHTHTHARAQIRPRNEAVFNPPRALDRQKGRQTNPPPPPPHIRHICFLQENGNHKNNNLYKILSFCTHIPLLYETF
jgi:hypothetical protein